MSKYIYFDAVASMKPYNEPKGLTLEETVKNDLIQCETSEEEAKLIIDYCMGFLSQNNDFKVCLALVFNYYPSKFHYKDYEGTVLLIKALESELITKKEFNKAIGYHLL